MSAPPHNFEPEDGLKKRRKRTVKIKDPNAPKKPATPFFLFCSEGRATVKGDLGAEAEFKDVQAELKARWEMLPTEEKQVCYRWLSRLCCRVMGTRGVEPRYGAIANINQAWSSLYQVKLAEWKKINEAYQTTKAANQTAAEAAVTPSAPSAGGFTAVNHNKPIEADETEDDEEEEEVEAEADEEEEPNEPEAIVEDSPEPQQDEEEEEEEQATTKQVSSSDSSLSPPPAEPEKPKSTPRGRKPRGTPSKPTPVAAEEVASTEKSTRKRGRGKKNEEAEVPATPVVEEKKRGRKRRKSNTTNE